MISILAGLAQASGRARAGAGTAMCERNYADARQSGHRAAGAGVRPLLQYCARP